MTRFVSTTRLVKLVTTVTCASEVSEPQTCGFGYEKDYIAEVGTSGTVGTGGKQKVWGIRSTDDVVMVASYKLGDQQSERNAVRRIEQLP